MHKNKEVTLISHDCLSILIMLHKMLNIMPAYLMLLAALSDAACLYNVFLCY